MPLACFIVSTRPVPPPIQLQACGVYLPFFPLLLLPQPFSAISPHVAHPPIACPFPLSPAMSLPAPPLLTILRLLHHFSPSEWGTKFTVRLFLTSSLTTIYVHTRHLDASTKPTGLGLSRTTGVRR